MAAKQSRSDQAANPGTIACEYGKSVVAERHFDDGRFG
jgi:hypothetical protein